MSHESVWNSRPRGYGKGARSWYVMDKIYTSMKEDEDGAGDPMS